MLNRRTIVLAGAFLAPFVMGAGILLFVLIGGHGSGDSSSVVAGSSEQTREGLIARAQDCYGGMLVGGDSGKMYACTDRSYRDRCSFDQFVSLVAFGRLLLGGVQFQVVDAQRASAATP